MRDEAFVGACERGEVRGADFRHADHLRLALAYLGEYRSVDAATDRMARTLRGLAAAAGHPEKYHHTLTVFWMRRVAALLDKELPLAYYSRQRLFDDEARRGWVEPDLQPLDAPPQVAHAAATGSFDSSGDAPDRSLSR